MVLEDVNLHLPMPECCAVSPTLVISVRQSLHFCLMLVLPFLLLHFITHHLCFEAFAAIRVWKNLLFYLVLAPHLQHFYTNCILLLSSNAYKSTEYIKCACMASQLLIHGVGAQIHCMDIGQLLVNFTDPHIFTLYFSTYAFYLEIC